jgi:dihydrodipicolinate synthase/N-acetylneuraminate lyase
MVATVGPEALARSVIAVPPLAVDEDGLPLREPNRKLAERLVEGGVGTLLYGGNANLYHLGSDRFEEVLAGLAGLAPAAARVIPSIGPDYGTMRAQARALARSAFPTAMVLPMASVTTPEGVASGLRHVAGICGRPLILYIKSEGYITPELAATLVEEGAVWAIKYAIERPDPARDPFLDRLLALVPRELVVSGMGERPAVAHMADVGLAGFTSGLVCLAPRISSAMLAALRAGDRARAEALRARFLPLEELRDRLSPIRVLHDAVTLAGIADMGRLRPLSSNLSAEERRLLERPVAELLAAERDLAGAAAA